MLLVFCLPFRSLNLVIVVRNLLPVTSDLVRRAIRNMGVTNVLRCHAIVLNEVAILRDHVSVNLNVCVALFRGRGPDMNVGVNAIIQFRLSNLMTRYLDLIRVLTFLTRVMNMIIRHRCIINFPLRTKVVNYGNYVLLVLLVRSITRRNVRVEGRIINERFVRLDRARPRLVRHHVFILVLVMDRASRVVRSRLFQVMFINDLHLLSRLVVFLLVPRRLGNLSTHVNVI